MATALVALANVTLATTPSTVTFSSISGSYRDLRLVYTYKATASNNPKIQFNSDSAGNYNRVEMYGNGSSAASGASASDSGIKDSYSIGSSSSEDSLVIIDILDYTATDKHKPVLIRFNRAGAGTTALAGRWASTAAITSIVFTLGYAGDTFVSSSSFALYGISA